LEVEGAVHVETQAGAGLTEGYRGAEEHSEKVDEWVFGRDVEAAVGCPVGNLVVVKLSGRGSNERAGVTAEMVADVDRNGTAGSCWDGHSEPSAAGGECIESVAAR
jgi:hypothetical protein